MRGKSDILSKLRRRTIHAVREASSIIGLNERLFREARGARMLIYHGICLRDHTRFNPIFLTRDMFESHLKFYKKYFNVVSLDDYFSGRFNNDCFNVCITFDDGYANNYKYVLPLLEKYEAPAAFFVTAIRDAGYDILWNDFLGVVTKYGPQKLIYENVAYQKDKHGKYKDMVSGKTLVDYLKENGFERKKLMMEKWRDLFPSNKQDEDYWLQMTGEEIRLLSSSPFVSIGSHGYFHNRMDNLPVQEAVEDMKCSREFLEKVTGKKIKALAFPYGSYSRRLVEEAKKLGYEQLLAMDFHYPEDEDDEIMRERFTVNPFISLNNQMYATVTGRYE